MYNEDVSIRQPTTSIMHVYTITHQCF